MTKDEAALVLKVQALSIQCDEVGSALAKVKEMAAEIFGAIMSAEAKALTEGQS